VLNNQNSLMRSVYLIFLTTDVQNLRRPRFKIYMLSVKYFVEFKIKPESWVTPLHIASVTDYDYSLKIEEILIKADTDVNVQGFKTKYPLYLIISHPFHRDRDPEEDISDRLAK